MELIAKAKTMCNVTVVFNFLQMFLNIDLIVL